MKRSLNILIYMLLIFTLVFPLTGCSLINKEESKQEEQEEKEEKSSKKDKKKKKKKKEKEDPVEEPSKEEDKLYILSDSIYSDKFFIVDSDGNIIKEFDSSSLTRNLPASDDMCACEYGDGYFFYKVYHYNDKDNGYYSSIYAIDEDDYSATFLFDVTEGYVNSAEYYNGALRVLVSKNNSDYEEHLVPIVDGKLGPDTVDISPVLQTMNDNDYYFCFSSNDRNNIWGMTSLERLMDNNGFVLAKGPGGKCVAIDPEGKTTELTMIGGTDVVRGYDKGYVIYTSDESNKVMCLAFDPAGNDGSEKVDTVCSRDDFNELGFFDGKFYYSVFHEGDYMMNPSDVCVYDPQVGASKILYSHVPVPGTSTEIGTSPSAFCVINDVIYSKELIDKDLEIAKVSISSGKPEYTGIGCKLKTPSVFKYGSVIYDTRRETCPYCGIALSEEYDEAFVLDPKYSEYADKINEVTRSALDLAMAYYDEPHEYTEDECEYHLEEPVMYDVTSYCYVQDVFTIDDRYLAVNMSGYWYGGGAHGYPLRNQYLFDLETGEQKTISDFYEGSTADFKEVCARFTADDFLSYDGEFSPYFSDNEQEVYDQAYEEADLTASYIEFAEEGVFLVYSPYDMGPYSSGWIDIYIPYYHLFNRHNLADY